MPERQMPRSIAVWQLQTNSGIGKLLLLIIDLIAEDLIPAEIGAPEQLTCLF